MKRLLKHALGGIALFAALSGGALAVPVTLDVLFAGGSIIAGDKLFDNWTFTFDASDPLRTFTESNIEVTALNDGGDNPGPGLSFSVLNGELGVSGDGIYAYVDLQIGFRASVLPGAGKLIKDNSLELTGGSVTGTGDNGYYINESIGTSAGQNCPSSPSMEV